MFFENLGKEIGGYKYYIGQDEHGEPVWGVDKAGKVVRDQLSVDKIERQTGILKRHKIGKGQSILSLADQAFFNACRGAGSSIGIKGIITSTVTHDRLFPSTACFLQNILTIQYLYVS